MERDEGRLERSLDLGSHEANESEVVKESKLGFYALVGGVVAAAAGTLIYVAYNVRDWADRFYGGN